MTEHQKLHKICNQIWFIFSKNSEYYDWNYCIFVREWRSARLSEWIKDFKIISNVREIIFTQKFMDLFLKYLAIKFINEDNPKNYIRIDYEQIKSQLLMNLDNPVDYIYNLIFNTTN